MLRLLSHLLLLLYAGAYLHCQSLPARVERAIDAGSNHSEQRRGSFCRKKQQTVQAAPPVKKAHYAQAQPLDRYLGSDFAASYFSLLFPARQLSLPPARGPDAGPVQALANHPNKAPPVRFS